MNIIDQKIGDLFLRTLNFVSKEVFEDKLHDCVSLDRFDYLMDEVDLVKKKYVSHKIFDKFMEDIKVLANKIPNLVTKDAHILKCTTMMQEINDELAERPKHEVVKGHIDELNRSVLNEILITKEQLDKSDQDLQKVCIK